MPLQEAFFGTCVSAGYPETYDHNHTYATGVGPIPMNNSNGMRMSTAMTYINPNRHRMNLTIRANVQVQRILFEGRRATGVEVESGGERFVVEGDLIVLSAGASPQLLMLSGVGPKAHLKEMGIPVVHDLAGVGHNLRDHPIVAVRVKVKDDFPLDATAPRMETVLRYAAAGSDLRNDMQILPSSFSTPLGGAPLEEKGIRFSRLMELAISSGEVKLTSTDPSVQPYIDVGTSKNARTQNGCERLSE